MQEEARNTIENVLKKALTTLEPFTPQESETHLVWKRREDGAWAGGYEDQPSLLSVLDKGDWRALAGEVREAFRKYHPEYLGFVGTTLRGWMQGDFWLSNVLRWMIMELWRRHSTWSPGDGAISALIQDFANFIDNPTIPVTYLAPLVNFHLDEGIGPISLPDGVTIKRLNEKEISEIYGGPIESLATRPRSNWPHEFAFIGNFEEPKIVSENLENLPTRSSAYSKVRTAP